MSKYSVVCTGDMGFDGTSGMIQDANLDDTLYKNTDSSSCFLMDGGAAFQGDGTRVDDQPMAVGFDAGPTTHHEDGFASGGDDYGMLPHLIALSGKNTYWLSDNWWDC